MVTLKHPPLGPLMLKHPLLGPLLKHPLLGPLLRLRRPTKSESTSSAISSFGATSTYTSLETAVDKGDAADRVGGTPYRICRRQNINQASYDRAGACATTTSAGRKETSPLWQRQAPALYLPFAHAFASTAARVRMRPRPRNERRGLGRCKPYQGTPSVLEFEFGSLQIREIWVNMGAFKLITS